jgi:hypothetical protein
VEPTPERIFTEIQETFQQQMWEGDDRVDPTPERIFTEIRKHFNNKCGKLTIEWTHHRKEFSLKLRNISTINTESDSGVDPWTNEL